MVTKTVTVWAVAERRIDGTVEYPAFRLTRDQIRPQLRGVIYSKGPPLWSGRRLNAYRDRFELDNGTVVQAEQCEIHVVGPSPTGKWLATWDKLPGIEGVGISPKTATQDFVKQAQERPTRYTRAVNKVEGKEK